MIVISARRAKMLTFNEKVHCVLIMGWTYYLCVDKIVFVGFVLHKVVFKSYALYDTEFDVSELAFNLF
jgi:hypothetical protein